GGNLDHEVLAILPGAVVARARAPRRRTVTRRFAAVKERAHVRIHHQRDASPVATIAAVGPPLRHVLLAPEAHAAVAALPGDDVDAGVVDQHRRPRTATLTLRLRPG